MAKYSIVHASVSGETREAGLVETTAGMTALMHLLNAAHTTVSAVVFRVEARTKKGNTVVKCNPGFSIDSIRAEEIWFSLTAEVPNNMY